MCGENVVFEHPSVDTGRYLVSLEVDNAPSIINRVIKWLDIMPAAAPYGSKYLINRNFRPFKHFFELYLTRG